MPLTAKGEKILAAMTRPESEGGYGEEKGKEVFYASANAGTITGVHEGGGKRKRKKRLAKAGFRRVLYLFFKAEQGKLFSMPTGVKGYVTRSGKVVSAYTAKRKKAGDDQSGDLFSLAAKPEPAAEKPVAKEMTDKEKWLAQFERDWNLVPGTGIEKTAPKDEPAPGMEPFTGKNKYYGTVTFQPGNSFKTGHPEDEIVDVKYVMVPDLKTRELRRFADAGEPEPKVIGGCPYRIGTYVSSRWGGDILYEIQYPTNHHHQGGNHVILWYDKLPTEAFERDDSTVWRAVGPVVRKMMDEAKAKYGQKTSSEEFALFWGNPMPNEHATRRMLRNHLVDVETAHRNSVAAEKQILESAEKRSEVVEREIERIRPLTLADDAAGDRYMELVNERGRLANVMALARRHLRGGWG